MKLTYLFFVLIIGLLSFIFMWNAVYFISGSQDFLNKQMDDRFASILHVHKERIDDVFFEGEKDIAFLSDSNRVREILRKNLTKSSASVKLEVDYLASTLLKEIEDYIVTHSEMTLEDLRESREFREIVIQRVGENGYSMILDSDDLEIQLCHDVSLEGSVIGEFGYIEKITEDLDSVGSGQGFYNWSEGGRVAEKYINFKKVNVNTFDSKTLVLGVAAYVDDYFVADNVSPNIQDYFYNFNFIKGFQNILFLSRDNRVIFMANRDVGIGGKLENFIKSTDDVSSIVDGLGVGEVAVYGPFASHYGGDLKFILISNVYDGNFLMGSIAVVESMEGINRILKSGIESQAENELYLINRDGFLLTPLKNTAYVGMLMEKVKTENVEKCFLEVPNDNSELSYSGDDLTFDYHELIEDAEWCLVYEIDSELFWSKPLQENTNRYILFISMLFCFMILLTAVLSSYFFRGYVVKRK